MNYNIYAVEVEYVHYIFFHDREGILFISTTTVQKCCIVGPFLLFNATDNEIITTLYFIFTT